MMEFSLETFNFVYGKVFNMWYFREILTFVGVLYTGKLLASFACSLIQATNTYFIPKLVKPVDFKEKYGPWAVVTGCTSGVGKAYVLELAKRGMNIVLVSRDEQKIRALSRTIRYRYNVDAISVVMDFGEGRGFYSKIKDVLADHAVEIGILVNNVGVISFRPLQLIEMTEDDIWEHINVNVAAATIMTHLVLPYMRFVNRGAIINISSISAIGPAPLLAVYAATKAYIDSFSQAVRKECAGTNIEVQTLIPSYINTQMVDYSQLLKEAGRFVPPPDVYVSHAINTLGYAARTTGYWLHSFQLWMIEAFCPRWAWISMVAKGNKAMRATYITSATNNENDNNRK